MKTSIEWTDESWNPLRARHTNSGKRGHYCEKISPGCANCYASTFQSRFGLPVFTGPSHRAASLEQVEPYLDEKVLREPLGWKKPRRVFVCSMTDLFLDVYPDEWIDRVFAVMALAKSHTFQVLTKRPERMRQWFESIRGNCSRFTSIVNCEDYVADWPLPNVWLGTSVEDQQRADERIPHLLECPAAVRFLSCEPLLGRIDFGNIPAPTHPDCFIGFISAIDNDIHWVIIGGESGPGSRECDVNAVRDLVRQCKRVKVACFVKQLGSKPVLYADPLPAPQSAESMLIHGEYDPEPVRLRLKSPKGGDPSEFPPDLQVREFPHA